VITEPREIESWFAQAEVFFLRPFGNWFFAAVYWRSIGYGRTAIRCSRWRF